MNMAEDNTTNARDTRDPVKEWITEANAATLDTMRKD